MAGFAWSLPPPKFFEKFEQVPSEKSTENIRNQKLQRLGNPIFIAEDVCCIWWSAKRTFVRALCSDIWMNSDADTTSCQEWQLDDSVNFEVTQLTGRKFPREIILAWGPSGLAVIKYEARPGLKNSSLTCHLVAEKTYVEHLKLRIIQVKLHPTKKDDIVAVLNNDFYIRLYNLDNPNETIGVVNAGHVESTPFIYSSHAVGLPEPPVDFEFGQRLEKSGRWVVFILKSSGRISYRLLKTLDTSNKCFWEAEQTIYTNEDLEDAFEDAACFFVTKTFPPVLTIACLNGNLYHTVLLPSDTDSNDITTDVHMEEKFWCGDVTLYVKEVLELEPDNDSGFNSLKLIQDPLCSHRYACLHDEGVHLINIHFITNLVSIMQGTKDSSNCGHSLEDEKSTLRYVLCTKADGGDTINERGINIAFTESVPQKFLLLFGNGETLVYEIPHALDSFPAKSGGKFLEDSRLPGEKSEALISEDQLAGQDKDLAEFNIEEVTKKLLTKNSNLPYLAHEEGKDLDFEKNEALLMKGIRILKWEYLQRQEQAMEFLKESLDMLVQKSSDLKEDVDKLSSTQVNLRNRAEAIAESYEEANEKEEGLHKRLESVLQRYHQAFPLITDEEKGWIRKLEALQVEIESMRTLVDGLKRNVSAESPKLRSLAPVQRRTTRLLSSTQLTQIRNQVLEQHVALAHLAQSMKELEKKISLS